MTWSEFIQPPELKTIAETESTTDAAGGLNLHHILWARGEPAMPPADMPETERSAWSDGIAFYAPYAKRNLLFDDDLLEIKESLGTVETDASLEGVAIDRSVKATLERLMPIYRKHWWPAHDRKNREWIAAARTFPPQLSHAVLFYTAGELTARELLQHGIAYKHYAQDGLYDRLCGTGCRDKLAAHWGPFLDGKRTRTEAFTALAGTFK